MTPEQSVMSSLFTAFAGFTAFGAAIVAVLAGGGAVQKVADRWVLHAQREGDRLAWLRSPILVVTSAVLVCLVVLDSGVGLLLSFLWQHTGGSHGWEWTYGVSEVLFWCEVIGVTVVTALAVVAAGVSSVAAGPDGSGQEQQARDALAAPVQPATVRAIAETLLRLADAPDGAAAPVR